MKKIFFPLLFCVATNALAQDCTKELLAQKPGTWKAGIQGSIQNVGAADLVKEKSVMASVHKMVAAGYKPKGCQVSYSTVYGKHVAAATNWVADPYQYSMYVLRYVCDEASADKSKYYVDISTPTTVNVTANVMHWVNTLYAAELDADDFRGYLKLKSRPEKRDGYYYMGEEVVGDGHRVNKIKEYRWLITYADTLPFVYVTRKEYLAIQKKRLEKLLAESPSEKVYNQKFIDNINAYLKKPESELSRPAVCRWNEEERFESFVEEGSPGSFIAIKPNAGYYHQKLSKATPQFFTVVFKIAHGDPVFEENMAAIKKAIDFASLKNMLGK
jgi:hypothetical protein